MAIKDLGKNERKFLSDYFEGALAALYPPEEASSAVKYAAGTLSFKFFTAARKAKTDSMQEVEQSIAELSATIADAKKVPEMKPVLAKLSILEAFTYGLSPKKHRAGLGSYYDSMFFPDKPEQNRLVI